MCRPCRNTHGAAPRQCVDCGAKTTRFGAIALCGSCALERQRARWRRKHVARKGASIVGPKLTRRQLGDRDGWVCHLCDEPVDPSLQHPHPRSATFDHLIPIADGGVDSPSNVKLAHRDCNIRRGRRPLDQAVA